MSIITNKSSIAFEEIIFFANYLADIARPIASKYFRSFHEDIGEIAKEDDSPVTKADQEIERAIRKEIESRFPEHGIDGEEYGIKESKSGFTWIIDPIDGTSSFIMGRPIFGILIALAYEGEVVLGLMDQPIAKERWVGAEGRKTTFNNGEIKTRQCKSLSEAIMCSGSPFYFKGGDELVLESLSSRTKYQKFGGVIYGGDCYSYGCLALGFVDLVIDPGLKLYDFAALLPIIKGAGGVVSDWNGNKIKLESEVKMIACANEKLLEEAILVINFVK